MVAQEAQIQKTFEEQFTKLRDKNAMYGMDVDKNAVNAVDYLKSKEFISGIPSQLVNEANDFSIPKLRFQDVIIVTLKI